MKRTVLILVVAALGLSACATVPPKSDIAAYEEYKKNNDPLEPMNRGVFAFNTAIDNTLVRPVVKGYNKVAPEPLRHTVSNFLRNLKEPWTFINEILQGKPGDAIKTFSRFTLNTTLGIGGLNDLTDEVGMKHTEEDFGQTLGVWGAGEGFYLVLPGFGPSNLRDTAGIAADFTITSPSSIPASDAGLSGKTFATSAPLASSRSRDHRLRQTLRSAGHPVGRTRPAQCARHRRLSWYRR